MSDLLEPAPKALPVPVRNATLVAIALSAAIAFGAMGEVGLMANLSAMRDAPEWSTQGSDPYVQKLLREQKPAYQRALEGMKVSRGIINGLLAFSAFLGVAAGLQFLRPSGSREGARRLLSLACLASAVLRALDGAQHSVAWKRVSRSLASVLAEAPDRAVALMYESVFLVVAVVSLGLAGVFLLLSRYFASTRVQQIVQLAERQS